VRYQIYYIVINLSRSSVRHGCNHTNAVDRDKHARKAPLIRRHQSETRYSNYLTAGSTPTAPRYDDSVSLTISQR